MRKWSHETTAVPPVPGPTRPVTKRFQMVRHQLSHKHTKITAQKGKDSCQFSKKSAIIWTNKMLNYNQSHFGYSVLKHQNLKRNYYQQLFKWKTKQNVPSQVQSAVEKLL